MNGVNSPEWSEQMQKQRTNDAVTLKLSSGPSLSFFSMQSCVSHSKSSTADAKIDRNEVFCGSIDSISKYSQFPFPENFCEWMSWKEPLVLKQFAYCNNLLYFVVEFTSILEISGDRSEERKVSEKKRKKRKEKVGKEKREKSARSAFAAMSAHIFSFFRDDFKILTPLLNFVIYSCFYRLFRRIAYKTLPCML